MGSGVVLLLLLTIPVQHLRAVVLLHDHVAGSVPQLLPLETWSCLKTAKAQQPAAAKWQKAFVTAGNVNIISCGVYQIQGVQSMVGDSGFDMSL